MNLMEQYQYKTCAAISDLSSDFFFKTEHRTRLLYLVPSTKQCSGVGELRTPLNPHSLERKG